MDDNAKRVAVVALKMKAKNLAVELVELAGELSVAAMLLVRGLRLHLGEFNAKAERDPKAVS